jgi:cytoskeleton protein RodZ
MNEHSPIQSERDEPLAAGTAGGVLRQARLAQGLSMDALAAAIKVTPRKLELLETDQVEQLPDATFTRALAQTVCRTLKIDAKSVLALLPPLSGQHGRGLEGVAEGLNTPFRERPGRLVPRDWGRLTKGPLPWVAALLILILALAWVVRDAWWPLRFSQSGIASSAHLSAQSAASAAEMLQVASLVPTVKEWVGQPAELVALPAAASAAVPFVLPFVELTRAGFVTSETQTEGAARSVLGGSGKR